MRTPKRSAQLDDGLHVARVERLHDRLRADAVVARVVDEPRGVVAGRAREEHPPAHGRSAAPGRRGLGAAPPRRARRQRELERAGRAEAEEGAPIEGHGRS